MNDQAIRTIIDYSNEHLFEPDSKWPQHEFELRSYSRWAAFEIVQRIMDHPKTPARNTVEEFLIKMLYYSSLSDGTKPGTVYSIAIYTAEDILELI